jgi:beta-lactam-binding protein with PASTA domain
MPEGGRVQLFVNPTNDTAVIPEVAGMTLDDARQALEAAGFRVIEAVTEQNNDVAEGRVIRTDPGEGEEAGVQDRITVFVAGASATSTTEAGIPVPFVIGATEASARQAITDAGLEVDVVYIDRPFGDQYDDEVMDQNPRVPARLAEGEVVTINVGRASEAPPQTNPPQTNPPQTNPPQTNPPQTNPPQTTSPQTTSPPTTTTPATSTTTGP